MSYVEIRNVIEMLRALGYPNLISMESFRTPNFPLVANLLIWLAKKFDSDVDIPLEIDHENERTALMRNIAQFMLSVLKANIKLNTKRLYQADGYAVKELLKITTLLYNALQENIFEIDDEFRSESEITARNFDISDKVNDLKQSRQLASEITSTGAKLYDMLGKEVDLRMLRHISAGRQFEVNELESGIKSAIDGIKKELNETKQLIENVSSSEVNLDAKIERRNIEIERYSKRLQTLKKVRPAFLEEFKELETELEKLFVQYAIRVRTLNHLEAMVDNAERFYLEKQQLASATKKTIETVPLTDDHLDLLNDETNQLDSSQEAQIKQERPRARTGGRSRALRTAKEFTLSALGSVSESSGDMSTETDTDDLLLDVEEPELNHSDDDSLGLDSPIIEKAPTLGDRRTNSRIQQSNSDDDF